MDYITFAKMQLSSRQRLRLQYFFRQPSALSGTAVVLLCSIDHANFTTSTRTLLEQFFSRMNESLEFKAAIKTCPVIAFRYANGDSLERGVIAQCQLMRRISIAFASH